MPADHGMQPQSARADANPYAPPQAAVADRLAAGDEFQPIRWWSSSGRMGRLRFIGCGIAAYFAAALLSLMAGAVFGRGSAATVVVSLAVFAAYVVVYTLWAIQRAHDLDFNGWLAILAWIPFLNFVFWFLPGTNGPNRYGPPPPPNRGGAAAWIVGVLVVVFLIGMLAAIAIPAYQDYTKRARAAQSR